jgi:predicted ATPase/class 3 adenylate cyclase
MMAELPSGTVTFLFTDIEGSTRLWEQSPAAMAPALARHDALMREAIEDRGGHIFTTVGDAFCAAFATAPDAILTALSAQRAVLAETWPEPISLKVRMALHTGIAEMRGRHYFGPSLNRVARLLAAGNGGQVLLSEATAAAARPALPPDTSLLDRGVHRLKDLQQPEKVFQLCHPDLPAQRSPLRSLSTHPNNLPQHLTSFIGREKEMADIEKLLAGTRLLTLAGSGGCGKTRLAMQVAADLLEAYPDGVWLVEFAALSDPALVPQTVAYALGLKEERGKSLLHTVTEYLASKRALLVLDNAEHLLVACAQLADSVLRQCAHVVLLVSSREGLGIAGELTYRVPSLPMPDPIRDDTPESVVRYDSARLFIERARLQVPQFAVTPQNASALASVCYRLDGIPLALELAAGRVRSMSVEEVNRRLDQTFRLLTGGSRTALPRQQTLRALIDWSYDLLSAHEQTLLWRVAVFAGGWTLGAVEQVCSGAGIEESSVLDLLTSLADKSLLQAEERDGTTRYRLLETVRQYARDRLLESGEAQRWRDRHLAHFLALAEQAEPQLMRADQRAWFDRVETEHDNLRSALTWSSAEGGDTVSGLRIAGALWWFWFVRGYFGEGRRWLSALLAAAPRGRAAAERAKALAGAGGLARQQGDYATARDLYEQSLALRRDLGDKRGVAAVRGDLGLIGFHLGEYAAARVLLNDSINALRELGDRQGLAMALNSLGMITMDEGDYEAAGLLYQESVAIRRELGDRHGIAMTVNNLGVIASHRGEFLAASALFEEGLAIRRELGDRRGVALTLHNLGIQTYQLGNKAAATALFEEGLAVFRKIGDRRGIALSLLELGSTASERGDYARARTLYEESLAIQRDSGDRQGVAISLSALGALACEQCDFQSGRRLYEESLAIVREIGDRRAIAEALEGLARAALLATAPGPAARLWAGADRLRKQIGAPAPPSERPRHEREVAAARAAIGDDAFERAWAEGSAMTLEQAMDYAVARPQS